MDETLVFVKFYNFGIMKKWVTEMIFTITFWNGRKGLLFAVLACVESKIVTIGFMSLKLSIG
jgi:hypothetical protein